MANKKIKFPLWLMPDTKATVECLYRQDGCNSQSEFIEKAILFYCSYLQSEYAGDFLPKILGETLEAILRMFGDRIGKLLLKQAVEQNVCNHILASDTDIDAQTYQQMRGKSYQEVLRTNGQISFPEVLRQQSRLVTDGATDTENRLHQPQKRRRLHEIYRHARGRRSLDRQGTSNRKAERDGFTKLLKDFPDVRDSFEYEDYKQAPTLHTASALISAALDSHMQNLQSENGYLRYIATRPGAEKHGAHGLFGREENTDLTAAMHDLTAHDGNVWTIIYSLHREDAERLGYNNAAAWQKLLVRQQSKFAEAFHVPASALHWYAAYHDADTHPHIHMMIWTDQKTVLKRDAVVKLRSAMTNSIFQAELENLYIRKDIAYKDVTEAARTAMHGLVDRHRIYLKIRQNRFSKKCWSLRWNCARAAAKSSMDISKSRSRTRSMKSWMNWKSCRRWRRIMLSGMVCATRWRATIKTDPGSTIRFPSRKNSVQLRMQSFRKQSAYGSKWNRNLRKPKNHLRRKLHQTLLQIRRLQMRILHPRFLTLYGFQANIF